MQEMNDTDAMALLQCQSEKVVADMGQEEGTKYMTDLVMKSVKEDGPPVQIKLWEEGYTCEEWGSN